MANIISCAWIFSLCLYCVFLCLFCLSRGEQRPKQRQIVPTCFPAARPSRGVNPPERMKCLPIVRPNYYVLNIYMTKMPLDFSSIY